MKREAIPRISTAEIQAALTRSGYLLEYRLVERLRRFRNPYFWVRSNLMIPDPATGLSREFDIEAASSVKTFAGYPVHIKAVLLIECMNNSQPVAFFTRLFGSLSGIGIRLVARPVRLERQDIADAISLFDYHHYARLRLAVQYCSFTRTRRDADWIASHADPHFETFEKLEMGIRRLMANEQANLLKASPDAAHIVLFYPVVVLQGQLLEVRPSRKEIDVRSRQHLVFRRRISQEARSRLQYVDVMIESYFARYVKQIKWELEKAAQAAREQRDGIKRGLESLQQRLAQGDEVTLERFGSPIEDIWPDL